MRKRAIVCDFSEYQGHVSWDDLAASALIDGAILRATFGNGGIDSCFSYNFKASLRVDLLDGTYHFADPDDLHARDPEEEAEHYVATVAALWDKRPLLWMLDIEKASRVNKGQPFLDWVKRFVLRVESLVGLGCWVYTGGPFWKEHAPILTEADSAFFARRHLVIAAYVDDPKPYVDMTPWKVVGPTLHQQWGDVGPRGQPGKRYPGVTANVVDTSYFEGTIEEFRDIVASNVSPTIPAPPGDEQAITVPGTPPAIRKSSQSIPALNLPIVDADDGTAVTPIRAGEGEQPYDPEKTPTG